MNVDNFINALRKKLGDIAENGDEEEAQEDCHVGGNHSDTWEMAFGFGRDLASEIRALMEEHAV